MKRSMLTIFTSVLVLSIPAFTLNAESVKELRTMQTIRAMHLEMKGCHAIEALSGYSGECSAGLTQDIGILLPQLQKNFSKSDWKRIINSPDATRMLNTYKRLKDIAKETAAERAARSESYRAEEAAERASRQAEKLARFKNRQEARKKLVNKIDQKLDRISNSFEGCAQHYENHAGYPVERTTCSNEGSLDLHKKMFYESYNNLSQSEKSRIDVSLLQTASQHYDTALSIYFKTREEARKAETCKGTKGFFGRLRMSDYQRMKCK